MMPYDEGINTLLIQAPPMLEEVLGISSPARRVALFWGGGDEVYWADGRITACGEWDAFLLFVEHPAVAPTLAPYDFGSSENEARHWLLLDCETRRVAVAPAETAQRLLQAQWSTPEPEPILVIETDEWDRLVEEIETRLARMTPQQIMTAIQEHRRLLRDLRDWLNQQSAQGQKG